MKRAQCHARAAGRIERRHDSARAGEPREIAAEVRPAPLARDRNRMELGVRAERVRQHVLPGARLGIDDQEAIDALRHVVEAVVHPVELQRGAAGDAKVGRRRAASAPG